MDEYLRHVVFHHIDNTLHFLMKGENLVIIVLYVDDLIITWNHEVNIK
jgi:hypothetical protein